MDLAEVLALMHSAPQRFKTLRAGAATWSDTDLYRRATEKGCGRRAAGYPANSHVSGGPQCRIWLGGHRRYRIEQDLDHLDHGAATETAVLVVDGDHWWWRRAGGGVMADHDGQPVFYANPLGIELAMITRPAWLDYEVLGPTQYDGRPCIAVLGRRVHAEGWSSPSPVALVGDERELLMDEETGVVLRFENRIDGQTFFTFGLTDVVFDEELSDELFAWSPPPDEPRTTYSEHLAETFLPLADAARCASFTVLVPDIGHDVCPMVMYHPPSRGRPERLSLHYRLPGADSVIIFEHAEEFDTSDSPDGEQVDIDGDSFLVTEPENDGDMLHIIGRRRGTAIMVSSSFSRGDAIDLVASMVPHEAATQES